ncbi:MAG TPA: STN domain-containing protein, partial [Steroidobacteraceae bacterium]
MRSVFRAKFIHIAILGVFALSASSAMAQSRSQYSAIRFDLPAQPLSESLRAVGRQSNINILFDPHVVGRWKAPALRLSATVEEALTQLLVGSDLHYR